MSRTTNAEIAGSLGMSVATVSQVLNGRSDVSPETRSRVDEALMRHNRRSASSVSRKPGLVRTFCPSARPLTVSLGPRRGRHSA